LRLPSISQAPGFADAGGLLQFGADVVQLFRSAAGHADRILRGARPKDLPIEEPTKYELVVNLKTAKALGLKMRRLHWPARTVSWSSRIVNCTASSRESEGRSSRVFPESSNARGSFPID